MAAPVLVFEVHVPSSALSRGIYSISSENLLSCAAQSAMIFGIRLIAIFVFLLVNHSLARATITINPWTPVFKGVDYTTGQADTNEVRQQKVCAFRVDLREPTIQFFSTPSNGTNDLETDGQTTTTFVNTYAVSFGINANFFSPVSTIPNDPRDLSGLAISRGDIVSPFESGRPSMLITRSNQVSIITSALSNYSNYWTAVSGSDKIVINGIAQLASCTNSFCLENPRSALGYSADLRYFYIMVIDGRQPGWSDGATLYETGQWLLRLGAWNGLNLDGGGSTALAKLESGSAILLNKPSGGVQRVDGNHLGVYAQPIAPEVLNQPLTTNRGLGQSVTLTVNAGGTTPLRYQWRFNGTNISSATASSYTRSNLQLSQFGYYTAVITNTSGSVTSAVAMLICTNPPAPPQISPHLSVSNGIVRLSVNADLGRFYALQASSDLVQWVTLFNFYNQQTNFQYLDFNTGYPNPRYYRIRWAAP
jgi:exopolysaccharide biosynthesis protein